jgi:carbamoyl-phosphate synthase large subunit
VSLCNVLISSAGRRVALMNLFRSALRDLRVGGAVAATDITPLAAAWQAADRQWIVPRCDAPEYVPYLLDLCERERIGLIVPTIDTELPVLAASRSRFAAIGTAVLVSSPEAVRIAADKRETNRWLSSNEFPTVRQTTVAGALADPDLWRFPLIAKPWNGSASIGLRRLDGRAALDALSGDDAYVIETVAAGQEHTVDVMVDSRGRAVCAVPRRRLEVRAGEVSKGVTVRNAAMQRLATRVAEALPGAFGALNIQMFADEEGRLSIVEINARFGGGFPLSARAGANFPRWILEDALGLPSTASADTWIDGLTMLRYDAEVFVEAAALVRT